MDEFLSEKEQIEQIREWWRENGWYLIGGVVLGIIGLVGWVQYNSYQQTQAEQAAAIYVELRQAVADDAAGDARSLLAELRADYPTSPYTDQGGLLVAVMRLDAGQLTGAIDDLRVVMDGTSDPELSLIARLRLARVLAQQASYDDALAALEVDPGTFSARYNEVRGDIHVAMGDSESARTAYNAALSTQEINLVDRNLVQMKLDALPPVPPQQAEEPVAEVTNTED